MSTGTARLVAVCKLLNEAHADYLVVGGFALSLHGVARATKKVDILIEASQDNVRRLLNALARLPWGLAGEHDPTEVAGRDETIIGGDPRVDILTLAWKVRYPEAAKACQKTTLNGVTIPYADIDTLISSKQTGRLQDRADIEQLERIRRLGVR